MLAYLKTLVNARRAHPGDVDTDVLTRLIEGEENGERLTETELLHRCIFLLNAGHETTTNLIGNALHALTEWPSEKAFLIEARDSAEPMRVAVEEFLRFESSNQLGNRITTGEVDVGGVTLSPRSRITMCIGAANRDPEQFADADRLDLRQARPLFSSSWNAPDLTTTLFDGTTAATAPPRRVQTQPPLR